jgi:hypothetical protein
VGDTIFARTRELGATLISYPVNAGFVIPTPNVTHQLSDVAHPPAHAQPLDMAVLDMDIDTYLKGERIILHPEARPNPSTGLDADFKQTGDYVLVDDDDFDLFPYPNLNLSVPLTDPDAPNNAIRMAPGKGVIDSVKEHRKEDLSLFRDWWPTNVDVSRNLHDMCSASGLYLLSVTVKADLPSTMTESDTPLMHITVTTVDSLNPDSPHSFVFTLMERHFFDASHHLITKPIEVLLGALELRQIPRLSNRDLPAVTFAAERDITQPLPHPWLDTTLIRYERILDGDDRAFSDSINGHYRGFDLRIQYGSGSSTFLLDAVCLSSPRVFGMLHADHEKFNNTFPAYASVRNNFINHTDHLLRDGGTGILPGMRFLYGPEQGRHSSNWPVSTLAQVLLDSISGGAVSLFCASGYSEPTDVSGAFNRRFVSGFYAYPVTMSFAAHGRRPVYPGIDVNEYYDSLNQYAKRGFVDMARIYRKHTKQRQQVSTIKPWIPFVQNHTNLYLGDSGAGWNDGDWLREPTAAELRHQCNIALANDADGVMIYALVSGPSERSIDPWWPETRQQWLDDLNLHPQTGGNIDMNAGTMGYLDRNLARRRCDWNGESKWDSTASYINNFLRPVADIIQEDLLWQDLKIWSIRGYPDAGENELVNEVLSMRQDAADPIDEDDSTFVIVSEFEHRDTGIPYLFVLNGRTHPIEGHRHITVKLTPLANPDDQYLVENVRSGDIWIVRPSDAPDSTTTANGFTDYFEPGAAALYRLQTMDAASLQFLSNTCFAHTLTITHGAVLSLSDMNVNLDAGAEIVVEDSLALLECNISCCDPENTAHIYVRDGGGMWIQGWSQSPYASFLSGIPVSVGPNSRLQLAGTSISGIPYGEPAVSLLDGYAALDANAADLTGGGHFVHIYGASELLARSDSVQGNNTGWTIGILAFGGTAYIKRERYLDLRHGIYALNGALVQGSEWTNPDLGRNKIRAYQLALYSDDAEIMLGERPWGYPGHWYASQNSIGLIDTVYAWHASSPSAAIYAYANFWGFGTATPLQPCAPIIEGNVIAGAPLLTDPVPFIGESGGATLQKELATPPPGTIRDVVHQHLANNALTSARTAMESFLLSGGGQTASVQDLGFLYRSIKHVDAQALVGDLLAVCVNRQDLRSKLLAADILEWEGDPASALAVLDSYSFAGSDTLLRDAMLRKAILHPLVARGGYAKGLAVLDTLAGLVYIDSTVGTFIDRYPILFSNLTHDMGPRIPKVQQRDYSAILLPTGIDVWPNYPNPFSDVTSFTFKLGEAAHVRLAIYDAMGREVAVVTDTDYDRGVHSAVLRSGALPSGMYFYRLTTDEGVIQRKMMLMR